MLSRSILLCILLLGSFSVYSELGTDMGLGMYVVVDDIERSTDFYRQLFQSDPAIDNGDFVGFRIGGGLFALYSKSAYSHEVAKGNRVVPYIRVNDIHKEFGRVKLLTTTMVHDKVLTEGPISLFMFRDPSGNPIEFYSLNYEQ